MINLVAFVITVVTTLLVVSFVVTISIFEDAVSTYSAFVGGDNQNSIIIACGYNPASSPATLATSEQLTKGATTRTVDVS